MNSTATQFARLMEKYALSRPVPPDDQRYIMRQRRASLKKILKRKGSYGIAIGTALAVGLAFRKIGISLSILQSKIIAGVAVAAISAGSVAGGYVTAAYVGGRIAGREEIPRGAEQEAPAVAPAPSVPRALSTNREIRDYYHKLEEINLDDGTRLIGAVISQKGGTATIHTVHGVITVPVKSIRNIRMLKE